ncbi:MAG: A24 family peptidase, partial [Candidatus Omnitrophica bacterium]|nr:A24 family peptidase [Candidatus Omnitrophota bacterium]
FLILIKRYNLTYDFFVYALFFCLLIVASFIDIKHRIIPDEISLGGIIIGFILISLKGVNISPFGYNYKYSLNSLLGIIFGGGIIFISGALFDLIYFRLLKRPPIQGETESIGGGDVKLLAMIGAFLGWERALLSFFLAPFLGAIIGIVNLIVKKGHTIPYGPFLSLSAILSLFFAEKIFEFVLFLR